MASVVLLGTTGEVEKVLVQAMLWFQLVFTTELSFAGVYHKAVVTSPLVIPVINQAQLVKSQVSVGTDILAVTLLEALAVNVFTVVQFF